MSLEQDKSALEYKNNDLEYRSMRNNLKFYGLPEQENENCVKHDKGPDWGKAADSTSWEFSV